MESLSSDLMRLALSREFGYYVAIGMGAGAIVAACLLLYPLFWFGYRLRRGARQLGMVALGSQGASSLISDILRSGNEFLSAWSSASVQLDGVATSPVDVIDFIGESDSYGWWSQFRLRLVSAVSGMLLGMGIFFTFLGITLGLGGIDTSDTDRLLEGVRQLLDGMSLAFISSLAGVILAISWTILQNWVRGYLSQSFEGFSAAVRRHFPWAPADELLIRTEQARGKAHSELLRRQVDLSERQAGLLQTLGVDIADAISGRFETSIQDVLAPTIATLTDELRAFAEKNSVRQTETLGEMLTEFRSGLTESIQSQAVQIARSLNESAAQIDRFHETLGSTLERLGDLSRVQTELLDSSSRAAREFKEGVEGLSDVHERILESSASFRESSKHLDQLVQGMKGEAELLSQSNAQLRDQLSGHLDQVSRHLGELGEGTARFETATNAMIPRLESAVTEFTGLAADKLVEVFRVFDREMATVTEHLGSTLHLMRVTIDELVPSAEQMNSSVGRLVEPLANSHTAMERLAEEVRSSKRALELLVEAVERSSVRAASTDGTARSSAQKPTRVRESEAEPQAGGEA